MSKLTQKRLKELLHYNSETGDFTWDCNRTGIRKDSKVGNDYSGYIRIRIFGRLYLAHRLAWLYEKGYFPENRLDHKDKIKYHNWIDNLREVSLQCNARNKGNASNNISGVKGVSWYKENEKWLATIGVNRKKKNLGYYKDFDDAVCARLAGEQCLNWAGCDSNSPAYQHVQKMLGR